MKGIILSGGTGSRLYPLTVSVNKQLLPVFDKPMIYYPLSTLINQGIKEIMIISTPEFLPEYRNLFGSGKHLGLSIQYEKQPKPEGIAQAFLIAENFIKDSDVALILGDNIFSTIHQYHFSEVNGAHIFAYEVTNPQSYGIVEFDKYDNPVSIEEKPKKPKSRFAVPGFYIYDKNVVNYTRHLKPSKRGELEITDLNRMYLNMNKLSVQKLKRGTVWLDAGTPTTLAQASNYVQTIQERQGFKIACIEEECYRKGFIDKKQLNSIIKNLPNSEYRNYLETIE